MKSDKYHIINVSITNIEKYQSNTIGCVKYFYKLQKNSLKKTNIIHN